MTPSRSPRSSGFGRNVRPIRAAKQSRHERPARRSRRSPLLCFVALALLAAFAAPIAIHHLGLADLRMSAPAVARSAPSPSRVAAEPAASPSRPSARHVPICSGGNRAERRLTCIVDGDTGWQDGRKWRLTSESGGVDAPDISKPECAAERSAGDRATRRLQTLMSSGYEMSVNGTDRYDRDLVVVVLTDGRDAGEILIAEGLAQPWPNSGNPWCR